MIDKKVRRGMRRGFSMVFAILFLVVLAVIGTMSLEFAGAATKNTTLSFMNTKADIYLKSGTEFAVMAIQGHDYSQNCLSHVNMQTPDGFDVNITLHYFMTDCGSCKECSVAETKDTNGSVLVYTTVSSSYFGIRKVRATLQNP